jgi:hypothetical protein
MERYRAHLLELRRESQASYDRTLMALSGGALGLSLTFLKQVIGQSPPTRLLLAAWSCWGLSLTVVLISHWCSGMALTRAIEQVGMGDTNSATLGQPFDKATRLLNLAGGLLFLGGLGCFIAFISNLVR